MKEVERLRREMLDDQVELGLDGEPDYEPEDPPESFAEEIDIMDTPRSPLLAPETDSNIEGIPDAIPDPPQPETTEGEGEQPPNKEKKKKSSKTLQEPLTRTERKAMKKGQPSHIRHSPSPQGNANDPPNDLKPNPARTKEATPQTTQPPGTEDAISRVNSPSMDSDVQHNILPERSDSQIGQTNNLPELSKREKRRAREAKKAEAGEKKESPVSSAMYQPFATV